MRARIRAEYRAKRRALDKQTRAQWNAQLEARVLESEPFRRAGTVLYYLPLEEEAGTALLAEKILAAGKRLLLPRCTARGVMEAAQARSLTALAPDVYGIPSPAEEIKAFPPEEIELVLAPGVAFDRFGGRIGQGGGCYDRFLPLCGAFRMGLAFSVQVAQGKLPVLAHDARLDALATEREIIIF